MGSAAVTTRRLSLRQTNGRVANAVAHLLSQKLTVPEIYMKPRVPGISGIDLLAVDHAGSGDVHGVEIAFSRIPLKAAELTSLIARLKGVPLHFKYLALPTPVATASAMYETLAGVRGFNADGIGRIGLIGYPEAYLDEYDSSNDAKTVLVVKPERFLLRGEKLAAVERFLSKSQPDIRVRI